jgi:hypothetical protein
MQTQFCQIARAINFEFAWSVTLLEQSVYSTLATLLKEN